MKVWINEETGETVTQLSPDLPEETVQYKAAKEVFKLLSDLKLLTFEDRLQTATLKGRFDYFQVLSHISAAIGSVIERQEDQKVEENKKRDPFEWDGSFTAFLLLSDFVQEAFPEIRHLTAHQADAIHRHARIIAKKLLAPDDGTGKFVYVPRKGE